MLRSQSDERLVDLVRAGNDRAFEAIVHRYRRQLLRYCGRFLTGPRAEDAVQQAFMNAYQAMKADERHIDLRPWLYRIAHNTSLNVLRSALPGGEEPISDEIDGVERPDQAAERRQSLADVVAAVQALPPRQRDALILHELEGRTYEQIAAELKVSGGAVRQLLSRARTTLRAGATAVVPEGLLVRLTSSSSEPIAARVGELVLAGGGVAVAAKVGTAVVVAGAVAIGVEGPIDVTADDERKGKRQAVTFSASPTGAGPGGTRGPGATTTDDESEAGERRERAESRERGERRSGRGRDDDDDERDGDSTRTEDDERSGRDSGSDDSGSGSGDDGNRSGSDSGSDDGVDNSGPGSGDDSEPDSSGPGDGTLLTQPESDNSGSGSSGSSDSSGSGSSGSGSDDSLMLTAPDSGSSGPGSGSDDD